jgi:hypothetical protein
VVSRKTSLIRCEANDNGSASPTGLREAIGKATKRPITKEGIIHNMETNESEKRLVFGTQPLPGALYPRPEIERRPETGDRGFVSVFAFDGAVPETINCRLAMLGFAWAFVVEKMTGMTVLEQVYSPGATGLPYFIGVVQLFTYATIVPIINGESTDARSWGPFNAKAERWNGRLAMIGFVALIIDELVRGSPVFH